MERKTPRRTLLQAGWKIGVNTLGIRLFNTLPSAVPLSKPTEEASLTFLPEFSLEISPRAKNYRQKYLLSCEVASVAKTVLALGIDEEVEDLIFYHFLPVQPNNGDPNTEQRGFIDRQRNPIVDMGVYAPALKEAVEKWSANYPPLTLRFNYLNANEEELKRALSRGHFVIFWATVGLRPSRRIPVQVRTGKTVDIVPGEHTALLTGYNEQGFFVDDVYGGWPRIEFAPTETLIERMRLFGHPALEVLVVDLALQNGDHYFAQNGNAEKNQGYIVKKEIMDFLRRIVDSQRLIGYPKSNFQQAENGNFYQVFDRGVVKKTPAGEITLENIFEVFEKKGIDLSKEQIPDSIRNDGSNGNFEKAKGIRLGWLTDQIIADAYDTNIALFGLPMSKPELFGDKIVQKFQRGVCWYSINPNSSELGKAHWLDVGELVKKYNLFPGLDYTPAQFDFAKYAQEVSR